MNWYIYIHNSVCNDTFQHLKKSWFAPEVQQVAPQEWWLEDNPFLLGAPCNFSGASCQTSKGGTYTPEI